MSLIRGIGVCALSGFRVVGLGLVLLALGIARVEKVLHNGTAKVNEAVDISEKLRLQLRVAVILDTCLGQVQRLGKRWVRVNLEPTKL